MVRTRSPSFLKRDGARLRSQSGWRTGDEWMLVRSLLGFESRCCRCRERSPGPSGTGFAVDSTGLHIIREQRMTQTSPSLIRRNWFFATLLVAAGFFASALVIGAIGMLIPPAWLQ